MGTRNSARSELSTGRAGWRQGRGDLASSWTLTSHRGYGCVTFARGMFCGETPVPGSRGVMNFGPFATLERAQLAVEEQLTRFNDAPVAVPTISRVAHRHAAERPSTQARPIVMPGERLARAPEFVAA